MDTDDILLNHPHDFFRIRHLPLSPNACFVMMPFAEEFTLVYQTIEEALKGVMVCTRADDLRLGQPILERILRGIATAGLIVADLTNCNPNVFYELGIAHTRTKNVLLLARKIDDVPFDLRQLSCQIYSVTSHESLQHLKAIIRRAADDVLARHLPRSLDGSITRTNQIVQFMRQRLQSPAGVKGMVIRVQATVSSIGNVGRTDSSHASAIEYGHLLEEERHLLIQLLEAGAILQAIISPHLLSVHSADPLPERQRRIARLVAFLERGDDCSTRCQFVISPSGGPNLLFIGTDVLFEGHKTSVEHGFGWTAVYTDLDFVHARIRVFDSLFESARIHTLQTYGIRDNDAPEEQRLHRAVLTGLQESMSDYGDAA